MAREGSGCSPPPASRGGPELPGFCLGPMVALPGSWLHCAQMPPSIPFLKPWLSILSKDLMLSQKNQIRGYRSVCVCVCECACARRWRGGHCRQGYPAPHLHAPPQPARPPRLGERHGNTVPFKHASLCCRCKAALGNLIKELAADKLCELKAFY